MRSKGDKSRKLVKEIEDGFPNLEDINMQIQEDKRSLISPNPNKTISRLIIIKVLIIKY